MTTCAIGQTGCDHHNGCDGEQHLECSTDDVVHGPLLRASVRDWKGRHTMHRLLIALGLLVIGLLAPATTTYAETYTWSDNVPKQGDSGMYLCTGEATYNGDTYRQTIRVGYDIDRTAAQERPNQQANCDRYMRAVEGGVPGWFLNQRGARIDPASVKVTGRFLP